MNIQSSYSFPNQEHATEYSISLESFATKMYRLAQTTFSSEKVEDLTFYDSFEGQGFTVSPELRKQLFAIVSEAFTNIRKSSECTEATIQFTCNEEGLTLEINDNGKGFDVENVESPGLGLKNFNLRAKEIGARLEIDSKIGVGTRFWLQIPDYPEI